MSRIDYNSGEAYVNLLSIGAPLARCTPLTNELDRPLYKELVIQDDPFYMRFLSHLTILLMYPIYTLTVQHWLSMAMQYLCTLLALQMHSTRSESL